MNENQLCCIPAGEGFQTEIGGGGEFFQVENLCGEVFQVDTKDMKKKLMSEWGIFSSQGGESFQVCGRIYAPEFLSYEGTTYRHTYIHTDIHTDRQTEPNYDIDHNLYF